MSNPSDYTVGWVCALTCEYVAAQEFLDEEHDPPDSLQPNDGNDYTLGKVGRHNVVIAVLPDGEYGTATAASVATSMLNSFRNVRIGLMVGIGGGAPSPTNDIRLGDIVVSAPREANGVTYGGVFEYDFGKTIQDQAFKQTRFLNQPPTTLRAAVQGLKTQYTRKGHQLGQAVSDVISKNPMLRDEYSRPHSSTDILFRSGSTHDSRGCAEFCARDPSSLEPRRQRTVYHDKPCIHYGTIASANQLMKNAIARDTLAKERNVLCFEMEAAGLMNDFPCLVIRGICDYSDSHKNKSWQGYAAMVAAAYAKDLLNRIIPSRIENEQRISELFTTALHALETTGDNVNAIKSRSDRRIELEILNWLTPIDYGPQQSDIFRRHQPGTGQPLGHIKSRFEDAISIEIRAHGEDVRKYVSGRLGELPMIVQGNVELREAIIHNISRAVDGMFLLAKLHFESLIGKMTAKAIRRTLESLPTGSDAYDSAYEEVMNRIEDQNKDKRDMAKKALLWITCAKWRLTKPELQEALAVELGETKLDQDNLPNMKDVASVCAGLVTIDEDSDILLLSKGANPHQAGTSSSTPPVALAALKGHAGVVEMLLKEGADSGTIPHESALTLSSPTAADQGYIHVITMLIRKGRCSGLGIPDYETALSAAARKGHDDIIRILLSCPNVAGMAGLTPEEVSLGPDHWPGVD
ncbi:hypothetical protein CEP51_010422 [Fusarium floridanum]|uniref:GPI inositol-deacylase winged helix domain-containing protein n=1 Tax=Fusarium floridanum TaxID=1325733 RepID=A0A428REK8_9HYPO|nr:hypothetical protein CEP51_010422 [Fusarium floridanum]